MLGLGLALVACSSGNGTADSTTSDTDQVTQGSDEGSDSDVAGEELDDESTDDGGTQESEESPETQEPRETEEPQEPLVIDGCPLSSGTVSDIVASALEAREPRDTLGDGVTCAYLHATDFFPDAAVTIGNWDGSERFWQDARDRNTELYGEPSDSPPDLGEVALLWNPAVEDEQTVLIVFEDGRYYTTTTNGFADPDRKLDIVVALYEAARSVGR